MEVCVPWALPLVCLPHACTGNQIPHQQGWPSRFSELSGALLRLGEKRGTRFLYHQEVFDSGNHEGMNGDVARPRQCCDALFFPGILSDTAIDRSCTTKKYIIGSERAGQGSTRELHLSVALS